MKICLISNWYQPYATSGAGIYINNIAKPLVESGHDVSVITMLPNYSGLASLTPKLELENEVKVYRFHPILETRLNFNLLNKKTIIPLWYLTEFYNFHSDYVIGKILKKEKPNIVHIHYLRGLSFSVVRIVKNLHIPLVYTCHDMRLLCPLSLLLKRSGKICKQPRIPCRIYSDIINRIVDSKPDIVTAPSQFVLDMHSKAGFFKNSKKITLPLGIEIENINFNKKEKDNKNVNILYVGQLGKHKGVHILITAFKQINKNAKLHIVGDGPDKEYFENLASNDKRIIFYGKILNEETRKFYKNADVVVVPSIWYENSPVVIYESFKSGTPVIGSNIGGIPELVKDGYNGFLFEPRNANELRKILEKIIENPKQLEELSKNAFESVKKYSMDKHIEKLINIYKEAIELNK